MGEMPCQVCGTRHPPVECPGELRATGPERHGWGIARTTRAGLVGCGVLLAPCRDLWRARIVTYPSALWMLPGGRGTLKFSGRFAEEAEHHAVREIRRTPPWESDSRVEVHAGPEGAGPGGGRRRRSLPIRFGIERPDRFGTIMNLSPGGLFLATPCPLLPGTELRLEVELFGHLAALRGRVVWVREQLAPARPRGMGLRLIDPAAAYAVFLRTLP